MRLSTLSLQRALLLSMPSNDASAGAIAVLETGKKVRARCLIGTDGANSRVARALKVPKPNYAGYAAYRSDTQRYGRMQHALQHSIHNCLVIGMAVKV